MTCDEAEILLHALIDGELDAGHAREVENHVAGCPHCAAVLQRLSRDEQGDRRSRRALQGAARTAPAHRGGAAATARRLPSRRAVLRGFAMGSAVSAMAATGLVAIVLRNDDVERDPVRGGLGASALAAGRPSHRRDLDRPAHGQTVVQRQARRLAAGDRPHRAGLYPDRRPARLCRCPRHRRRGLPPPPARHQPVRGADREHRTPRREDRNAAGLQHPPLERPRPELLGGQRSRRRRTGGVRREVRERDAGETEG